MNQDDLGKSIMKYGTDEYNTLGIVAANSCSTNSVLSYRTSIKSRILTVIHTWVERKLVAYNKKRLGIDVKCERCNMWLTKSLIRDFAVYHQYPWGYSIKCGNCKHTTYWNNTLAPVAVQCNERGEVICEY